MGAITAGAAIGSFGIALGTLFLREAFIESLFMGAVAVLLLVAAGVGLYLALTRQAITEKS